MDDIVSLANRFLAVDIKKSGAELCAIRKLPEKSDYMWNADPQVWSGYAPVLFPIIGALKNDTYFYRGNTYSLPRHGFVRNNPNTELLTSDERSATFCLKSSAETLSQYPFHFEFYISYTLIENTIVINHEVKNTGEGSMLFSLGGHPAFKCPLEEKEKYSDYFLEFDEVELAHTYEIKNNGLIGDEKDLIFNHSRTLDLHHSLFDKGALIFKNIKSRQVSLVSRLSGKRILLNYEGFPYLGIWAKPGADFLCIEPWLGIADSVDSNQQFENKEGMLRLEEKGSFSESYSISIL